MLIVVYGKICFLVFSVNKNMDRNRFLDWTIKLNKKKWFKKNDNILKFEEMLEALSSSKLKSFLQAPWMDPA